MDQDEEIDWLSSSRKYYHAFRILLFLGYTKQAENLLLISIEKFLKTYLSIRNNKSEEELKKEYRHNLKTLFFAAKLNLQKYTLIQKICEKADYNRIRYKNVAVVNELNLLTDQIENEIKYLNEDVILMLNQKYKTNLVKENWPNPKQDRKYKAYFLKMALKGRDKIYRIDFT